MEKEAVTVTVKLREECDRMRVSKEIAVAICQDYGFATADGWSDEKLARKVGELVNLYESGEFEVSDESIVGELKRLYTMDEDEELEIGDGETPEEAEDEEDGSEGCLLRVGDRGIVRDRDPDLDPWKGIVDEVLGPDHVMVRDRKGEIWEVRVEAFELKKRASETVEDPEKPKRERKPPKDEEEAEIRSLQERIQALKKKKGAAKKSKKLRRDEIAVRVLRAHPEGGVLEHLADEVEARWKKQGRPDNIQASTSTLKRLVKAGVLFGLLKMDGRRVLWTDSE